MHRVDVDARLLRDLAERIAQEALDPVLGDREDLRVGRVGVGLHCCSLSRAKTRDQRSTCARRATKRDSRRCSRDPASSRGINYIKPMRLFALFRTLIVAPLFVLLWLWWLPRWLGGPNVFADPRPLGWIVVAIGAVVALPCMWQFAWRGFGTPAPWDPPRQLRHRRPVPLRAQPDVRRHGRGHDRLRHHASPHATRVMLGELVFAAVAVSLFVIGYEEPALRSTFGDDVPRLLPQRPPLDSAPLSVVRSRAPGMIWLGRLQPG